MVGFLFSGGDVTAIQDIPNLKFEKYGLPNGLEVILVEDHRLPLVAVNLWYHVGPANERPGLTGFAHLFEHMMFEGSKYAGEKAHIRYLEAAGASEINGTTDFDRTNYFETVPSNQLELALWLESDRMGFLLDRLDGEMLENQRDVVRNERRQSIESAPYGLVQEALMHALFPNDHPYYASVIGSHEDIEAARLRDVREFFKLYYAPNNAGLAIVGDFDQEQTRALVQKYFGSIRAGEPVPRPDVQTPPITSEKRLVVQDDVELPRVYVGWITDPVYSQGDAECDLIARILGGGKSSRLYRRLVYEKRIAQDAAAQQCSLLLGSIFSIEATAKPGVTPEQLEGELNQEIDRFCAEGPTAYELDGARNTIESGVIRGLETLGGFGGVADRLNRYNHFFSDPGFLARDLERYRRATPDSVRDAARRMLARNSRALVYGVPGEKVVADVPKSIHEPEPAPEQQNTADQDWRANPPAAGPIPQMNLPVPKIFTLANGLTVYLVERHDLPVVSSNLILLSGSERNPADLPGLASFTAEMIDEGTAQRTALEIAAEAEQLGATLFAGSTADLSYVVCRSLKRNAEAAFSLAADVLLQPEFPEKEIERVRNDRITHIRLQKDVPNSLALKAFFKALYGQEHPYGFTEIGTEESNRAISREALVRFWQEGYAPQHSALVVAGDLTETELLRLAEVKFGSWAGTANRVLPPAKVQGKGRRVILIDKPGTPQSVLRIGHIGVERAHPDYVPLDVMNTALGGLFSSRINLNLRERHGFTYGASSAFVFRRGPGPFVVATGVRADATAQAITEIFSEIARMRDTEPSPEEMALAKDSIARSLPGLFETTSDTVSSIGQLFAHNLAEDYYRSLPKRIDRVTAAEVREVASKHLKPEEMVVVVVGDKNTVGPQLESLGFPLEFQ
jgi:zinc protease